MNRYRIAMWIVAVAIIGLFVEIDKLKKKLDSKKLEAE